MPMCMTPNRPRTLIMALYIEPEWLKEVPSRMGRERCAGLFRATVGRSVAAHPSAHAASRGRNDGESGRGADPRADAVGPHDRGDRAIHALAQLPDLDPRHERGELRLADPPRDGCDAGARIPRQCRSVREGRGPVARAVLPTVRDLARRLAKTLSQRRADGARARRGDARGDAARRAQRALRLSGAGAFHALLPRSCRRQPAVEFRNVSRLAG